MKLFWRKKPKEKTRDSGGEVSAIKVTHSTSTEASSHGENPANKDVLDELVEQGYDPENGGRLMLVESISYEDGVDRYAMKKSFEPVVSPEQDPQDEYSDDDSSSDEEEGEYSVGNSESRGSTFYTISNQKKESTKYQESEPAWSSPKRTINRRDNVVQNSWSLKSAGSMDDSKVYHSMNRDALQSNGSFPSFLDRVKSTPLDVGPADPPGQFLDKYYRINGAGSNDVSILSMKGAEETAIGAQKSESTTTSTSNISLSRNGSSSNSSSILLSSSLSDSADSSDYNNPWRWLSRPAAPSFRVGRKKNPSVEESPEILEYNKHRDSMRFQTAPSFVTGTFVSSSGESEEKEKTTNDEGAVECMIVPKRNHSDLPLEPIGGKNLPPTPRKKDVTRLLPEIHSRGKHFKAMQDYWKAKENGLTDIPRPPTFDPQLQANMSLEEAILMHAMSMGSMDIIPVPPEEDVTKTSKSLPNKSAKEEKLKFTMEAQSKDTAVEVAMEKKLSRLMKLKSKMSSTSSCSGSRSGKMKNFFQKKQKKAKHFEGVLQEDDMDAQAQPPGMGPNVFQKKQKKAKHFEGVLQEDDMNAQAQPGTGPMESQENAEPKPNIIASLKKPDPIAATQLAILKRKFQKPLSPHSPQTLVDPVSKNENQSFGDVPRNVMIHPDLGQDTMEEERVADEIVGFVKLMPVALMSFFRENPHEDDLILSLQPKGRRHIPRRGSSLSSSRLSIEGSKKPTNFMELNTPMARDLLKELPSEEESERTEKRRGGILSKLVKKKGGNEEKTTRYPNMMGMPKEVVEEIEHVTKNLKSTRMSKEAIQEMAEQEVKVKQKIDEGVEMIAGVTKQGKKAIVISNTKRHPIPNPEQVYHA